MNKTTLTDAELLVLGLVAEMDRYGFELEQIIKERGMRQWTQIGFSSIYFLLGKLERKELVQSQKPAGPKTKKIYSITKEGQRLLLGKTKELLAEFRPTYSSLLMGMVHWPLLTREEGLAALAERSQSLAEERERLEKLRFSRQPMPDYIEVLFDFTQNQLETEKEWLEKTYQYMKEKPKEQQ